MSSVTPDQPGPVSQTASTDQISDVQTDRKGAGLVLTCEWHGREVKLEFPEHWIRTEMSKELGIAKEEISEEVVLKGFEETALKVMKKFEDVIKEGRLDDIVLDIEIEDSFEVNEAGSIKATTDTEKLEETKQKVQKIAKGVFRNKDLFGAVSRPGLKQDAAVDHIKRLKRRREKKGKKPKLLSAKKDQAATFQINVDSRVTKEAIKSIEEYALSPEDQKTIKNDLTKKGQGKDRDHAISPATVDFYFQHVVGCSDKDVAALTSEQYQQVGDEENWDTLAEDLGLNSDPQPNQIRIHRYGDDNVSTLINVDLENKAITIHGYDSVDKVPDEEIDQLKAFLSDQLGMNEDEWKAFDDNHEESPVGGESAFFVCCAADQLNDGTKFSDIPPGTLDYKNEMLENIAIIPLLRRAMGITD